MHWTFTAQFDRHLIGDCTKACITPLPVPFFNFWYNICPVSQVPMALLQNPVLSAFFSFETFQKLVFIQSFLGFTDEMRKYANSTNYISCEEMTFTAMEKFKIKTQPKFQTSSHIIHTIAWMLKEASKMRKLRATTTF